MASLENNSLSITLKSKLESLQKYFNDDLQQLNPEHHLDLEKSQLIEFTEQLFRKAPQDFLARSEITELAEITARSYRIYDEFSSSKDNFRVEINSHKGTEDHPGYTSIICCLTDRAFVIDSLLEYWRKEDIDHYVSLYPILRSKDGSRIAVVYMQIENIAEKSRLKRIGNDLNTIVRDVILATDDFPQMLVQTETAARLLEIGIGFYDQKENDRKEVAQLLRWLASDGFVFLGYREWISTEQEAGQNHSHILSLNENADLGIFRSTNLALQDYLIEIQKDAEYLVSIDDLFYVSTTQVNSNIHRNSSMSLINVKVPQKEGRTVKIITLLGLYTKVFKQREARSLPVIRKKVDSIIESEQVLPNSHDYKEIVAILDSIPKSQLLRQPIEEIFKNVRTILSMQRRKEVRVCFYAEPNGRHFSILVAIPRKKFSGGVRSRILDYLASYFATSKDSIDLSTSVSAEPLTVIHYHVPNTNLAKDISRSELEKSIVYLTDTWDDKLLILLVEKYGKSTGKYLGQFYQDVFPNDYKAKIDYSDALIDIEQIEKLRDEDNLHISIAQAENQSEIPHYELNLYKLGPQFTLSNILPYLENIGFHVISETETILKREHEEWVTIYRLKVKTKSNAKLNLKNTSKLLIPGLKQILNRDAENDDLNTLLINPGLDTKQIAILRAIAKYLWQIKVYASEKIITDALRSNPDLSNSICTYFEIKFNPNLFSDEAKREQSLKREKVSIINKLKDVQQLLHDRVLRSLVNVIDSTLRTNAYQNSSSLTVSLKINCKSIEKMPVPRPMVEIFVNGPEVSGVHHRGGKIARGGIRWSDRTEDFRTEVLGLSKTQIVKNSIIIPTGAKGGFIVKRESRDNLELRENVEICYKTFIRSLLQITDNRKDQEIIRPLDTICYDEVDPYLVVAADKGTATFSDIANKIAVEEFNFWLGDAFASGGSNGYDHKKLSITASGAWVASCRHFRELGIDVDKTEFTLVGIGDMSGDVFGNGLLQNDNAKLIAAFNHKHIFIDPNPDSKISFVERKRLFELPVSNWTDYNSSLISHGGGIYDRASKEIELSPEAKKALGTNETLISGPELVKTILKAPVDLIWNGGIGTYAKSQEERDIDVGDPSNDEVRVNARDLRAKIVAEGGNLGFTQKARIEYSRIGGRINTDAVDNSGGVDLSDLEVNLKILLKGPVDRGELSEDERNQILNSHALQACDKVLRRNRSQSKAISLGLTRSASNLNYYQDLISHLEQIGLLNRESEYLPSNEEFRERAALGSGLTRPELAVLIGYVKMWLTNIITNSDLPEILHLEVFLTNYFPAELVKTYKSDVENHPLRREIIATQLANKIVERMGATYIYRVVSETSRSESDVILAFLAASNLIHARELSEELDIIDTANTTREFQNCLHIITQTLDVTSKWILTSTKSPLNVEEIINRYREPFLIAISKIKELLSAIELQRLNEQNDKLIKKGFPGDLVEKINALPSLVSLLGAIRIAVDTKESITDVAKLYSTLADKLFVNQLTKQASDLKANDKWESLSIKSAITILSNSLAVITQKVIVQNGNANLSQIDSFLHKNSEIIDQMQKCMKEFSNKPMNPAALSVIATQLKGLSER